MNVKPNTIQTKTALNPQVVFDAALADLNGGTRAGQSGERILRRVRPLRACTESTHLRQERALNEAAAALAKLWSTGTAHKKSF